MPRSKPSRKPTSSPQDVWLELKNPHAVLATLSLRPEEIRELRFYVAPKGVWRRIADLAQEKRIPVRDLGDGPGPEQPRPTSQKKEERSGHALALARPKPPVSLKQIWTAWQEIADQPAASRHGVWLALDSLTDPHNVGAIFRSASFFGVRGLIVTKNQSAPINATVHDISSGGIEYVPYTVVPSLNRAIKEAKQAGLWVLGSSEHAEQTLEEIDHERDWLVIVGNEQKGLRRLTLEKCDQLCSIPGAGRVGSLNVSVATGILLNALAAR